MAHFLLGLLLMFPSLALSQSPEADGFLIESIVFEGAPDRSLGVLRSTLQLELNGHYQEAELRQGIYRLERLPFVVEAQLKLERGSQRGAYQLRVAIVPSTLYFYAVSSEITATIVDYFEGGDNHDEEEENSDAEGRLSGLTVGRRWFLGRNGELNLFLPFNPGISYTHYNVFNRNVIASLALQAPGGFGKNYSSYPENAFLTKVEDRDAFGVSFSLSMLLASDQWLGFNYKLNAGEISKTTSIFDEPIEHQQTNFRNHKTEIVWRMDHKDHPLFPVRGDLWKVGLLLDREFRDPDNEDPLVGYDRLDVNNLFLYFSAQKFWELGKSRSFSLGALARTGQSNLDITNPESDFAVAPDYKSSKLAVQALFAKNYLDVPILGKSRDLRLESEVSYEWNRSDLEYTFPPSDFNRYKLRVGLVGRDNFGLIRFSLVLNSTNEELWQ